MAERAKPPSRVENCAACVGCCACTGLIVVVWVVFALSVSARTTSSLSVTPPDGGWERAWDCTTWRACDGLTVVLSMGDDDTRTFGLVPL